MGYILTDTIPAYELVADVTVSVATTSVTIGGLNFGKADDLLLVSDVINGGSASGVISLFVNGNTTTTNYYYQGLAGNNKTVSVERVNCNRIGYQINTGGYTRSAMVSKIKLTNNGYYVTQSDDTLFYGGSVTELHKEYCTSTFTITSITSLTASTTVSSGIGVGSRFQLYRRKATLLADTTISGSAVTSVDFTGLNLTAGNEVMLVSDMNYTSSSWTDINLYFNDNVTPANYYSQWLYANVSTITAGRGAGTAFSAGQSGVSQRSFVITPIKLTNSSYITYQTTENRQYSGSYINLQNVCGTSTFTTSSISSINIRCTITGGIGIGSRFQLY